MSSGREVEQTSASACTYHARVIKVDPEEPWVVEQSNIVADDGSWHGSSSNRQPCASLEEGTTIRVGPMDRDYGGWDDVHFHSNLRLPMQCPVRQGVVVLLEAMARECVAIALSPSPSFQLGKTYVVHFGASGNVQSVIRRRLPSGTEALDVTLPSRVCCPSDDWVSYWMVLDGDSGHVYCGVGQVPGKDCIGRLDDSLYHQLRSGVDAVRFVGLGNSALGRHARPLKIRNVCVTTMPSFLSDTLKALPPNEELPFVSVDSKDAADQQHQHDEELLKEYQEECRKARARATKFGVPYKEPSPQAFLQWSQARRLRANPERGFITGMDITSPEELAKQEARKARFGISSTTQMSKRKHDEDAEDEIQDEDEQHIQHDVEEEPLVVIQAWDNEELTRRHRSDPPSKLWVQPPSPESIVQETNEFALEPPPDPTFVEEKIHICSIDWAAFKQIRTDDIMAYFSAYGPSYVEWLGELSCNVLFEDKFSAARAFHNMSQEIPSPPPPPPELMSQSEATNEEMKVAEDDDDDVSHPSDEINENKGEDDTKPSNGDEMDEKDDSRVSPPDLGNMGWRFCRHPIKKVSNDRYGRRGTTARILMRVASSLDVLVERPTHWPAPPPGFTTKRVLGPGSDFDRGPRRKKRRKGSPHARSSSRDDHYNQDNSSAYEFGGTGDHPALSRGLASGRDGFSVEELEAERAAKSREQTDSTVEQSGDVEAREGSED